MSSGNFPEESFPLPAYRSDVSRLINADLDPARSHDQIGALVTGLITNLRASNSELVDQRSTNAELLSDKLKEHYNATHDDLTGALNLRGFREYLAFADTPKAVLMIDATNLKAVNDSYGYARGDKVIKDTYKILDKSLRPGDVVARIGGDEFVAILNDHIASSVPKDYNAKERRDPQSPNVDELIEATSQRVSILTRALLAKNPELTKQEISFDLAIGGAGWLKSKSLKKNIARAEAAMRAHKALQHKKVQYRR